MNILAIECSGKVAGVAVTKGDYVACELSLDGQLTHSQIFMPMLEECLLRASLDFSDIQGIVCNTGPGSFTGIRIGCSTANGLAAATGAKLLGVDALETLAYNAWQYSGYVVPVLDARADRIYAGIYKEGLPVMLPAACTVGDFIEALPKDGRPMLFLGEGAEMHFDAFQNAGPDRNLSMLAPMHMRRHRAGTLAALATEKFAAGEEVERCLPIYLRASQAEQERNRAVQ